MKGKNQKLEPQQKATILFRLAPQDWKSGEIPWLLAVLASKEVEHALVKKLEEPMFKEKTYKRFVLGIPQGLPSTVSPDA